MELKTVFFLTVKMPRNKDDVWGLYSTVTEASGKLCSTCKYCGSQFHFPNATRMKSHILKCNKVPPSIACHYKANAGYSGNAGTENVDDPPATGSGTSA